MFSASVYGGRTIIYLFLFFFLKKSKATVVKVLFLIHPMMQMVIRYLNILNNMTTYSLGMKWILFWLPWSVLSFWYVKLCYIICFSPPTFYEIITGAGSTWWSFDRCMFLLIELNFLTNCVIVSYSIFFFLKGCPILSYECLLFLFYYN